jgi:hypothetical protein
MSVVGIDEFERRLYEASSRFVVLFTGRVISRLDLHGLFEHRLFSQAIRRTI